MGKKRQRPWSSQTKTSTSTTSHVGRQSWVWALFWAAPLSCSTTTSRPFGFWTVVHAATPTTRTTNLPLQRRPKDNNAFDHSSDNFVMSNAQYAQCALSMVLNDVNPRDNRLSDDEFVGFCSRIISNVVNNDSNDDTANMFFLDDTQPLAKQPDVFQALFQQGLLRQQQDDDDDDDGTASTTIFVQGARPGSSNDPTQLTFLSDFCTWTYKAIQAWTNPTPTPTVAPSKTSATRTTIPTSSIPTTAYPTSPAPSGTTSQQPTTVWPTQWPTLAPMSSLSSSQPTNVPTRSILPPTTVPTRVVAPTHAPAVDGSSEAPSLRPSTVMPISTSSKDGLASNKPPPSPRTNVVSTMAPTLAPSSQKEEWLLEVYNSFLVGNTRGWKAWDLTLRGEIPKLEAAYQAFLNNVTASADPSPVMEASSRTSNCEIQSTRLYRILDTPCPRYFDSSSVLQPGNKPFCQSIYASVEIMVATSGGEVQAEENHDNLPGQLQSWYTNQTQKAIADRVLQTFLDDKRNVGNVNVWPMTVLGVANSLVPPVTMFPSRSPTATPTIAPTRVFTATIYNGFVVAYDAAGFPTENESAVLRQLLQQVYLPFVNRTIAPFLGGHHGKSFGTTIRHRHLVALGTVLESAQIYSVVNQANCGGGEEISGNDSNARVCANAYASFDLFFSNEGEKDDMVTFYTNVTQQGIASGALQSEVQNADLPTDMTILGLTDTNIPSPDTLSPTLVPSTISNAPTIPIRLTWVPTNMPTKNVPGTLETSSPTNIPTKNIPDATASPTEFSSSSPTESKRSFSPYPNIKTLPPVESGTEINASPSSSGSNSDFPVILAVGALMLLLGANLGCGICLFLRRRKARIDVLNKETPGSGTAVRNETLNATEKRDGADQVTVSLEDLKELLATKGNEPSQSRSMFGAQHGQTISASRKATPTPSPIQASTRHQTPVTSSLVEKTEIVGEDSMDLADIGLIQPPSYQDHGDSKAEGSIDLTEIGLIAPSQIQSACPQDRTEHHVGESLKARKDEPQAQVCDVAKAAIVSGGCQKDNETNMTAKAVPEVTAASPGNPRVTGTGSSRDIKSEDSLSDIHQTARKEMNTAESEVGSPDGQQIGESVKMRRSEEVVCDLVHVEESPSDLRLVEGKSLECSNADDSVNSSSDGSADVNAIHSSLEQTKVEIESNDGVSDIAASSSVGGVFEDNGSHENSLPNLKLQTREAVDISDNKHRSDPLESTPTLTNVDTFGDNSLSSSNNTFDLTAEQDTQEVDMVPAAPADATCSLPSEPQNDPSDSSDDNAIHTDPLSDDPSASSCEAVDAAKIETDNAPMETFPGEDRNRTDTSIEGVQIGTPGTIDAVVAKETNESVVGSLDETASLGDLSSQSSNASSAQVTVFPSDTTKHEIAPDDGGSDKSNYRNQVMQLLQEKMPDEVDNLDVLMEQFTGREEELIVALSTHDDSDIEYDDDDDASGDSFADDTSSHSAASRSTLDDLAMEYRHKIMELVQHVMPDEVNNVDVILDQFRGREQELIESLLNMASSSLEDVETDIEEEEEGVKMMEDDESSEESDSQSGDEGGNSM